MVGSLLSLPGPAMARVKSALGQDWLALRSWTHQDTPEKAWCPDPAPRLSLPWGLCLVSRNAASLHLPAAAVLMHWAGG